MFYFCRTRAPTVNFPVSWSTDSLISARRPKAFTLWSETSIIDRDIFIANKNVELS